MAAGDLGDGPSVFGWSFEGQDHFCILGVGALATLQLTSSSSVSPLV